MLKAGGAKGGGPVNLKVAPVTKRKEKGHPLKIPIVPIFTIYYAASVEKKPNSCRADTCLKHATCAAGKPILAHRNQGVD